MNFYIDCEFDGWMGPLISLALVSEDGDEFYWCVRKDEGWVKDAWVKDNVLPVLECAGAAATQTHDLSGGLERFLTRSAESSGAHVIADWPDDVAYFCRALIVGPGRRICTPPLTFAVTRVDAYPTDLPGAVQHNALWDARALRHALKQSRSLQRAPGDRE